MKTILIIDDEKDLCSLLRDILTRENFSVDCAYTLTEAAGKLSAHPEIILLDNNLPDGSSIDFIHEHATDLSRCAVIMISAEINPHVRALAEQQGIQHFIQKPFSIRSVKDMIRKVA